MTIRLGTGKLLTFFTVYDKMSRTLAGNNLYFFRPRRVWLLTSWLGTGKSLTFFTVYDNHPIGTTLLKKIWQFSVPSRDVTNLGRN